MFLFLYDLLYCPIHIVKKFICQPLPKTVYRILFCFTDPISMVSHWRLYRIKRYTTIGNTEIFDISSLKPGHDVANDAHLNNRIHRLLSDDIKNTHILSQHDIDVLLPSDEPIQIFNNIVIQGNGRVTALKKAGFTGVLIVKKRILKNKKAKFLYKYTV